MDQTQPLGLPQGSVRAVIALMFSGAACVLFVSGQQLSPPFLVILTAVVTWYFGYRSAAPTPEAPLEAPVFGGQDD